MGWPIVKKETLTLSEVSDQIRIIERKILAIGEPKNEDEEIEICYLERDLQRLRGLDSEFRKHWVN